MVPPFYDPLLAKLVVWGRDRIEAIQRMKRTLEEFVIKGRATNIPFHLAIMEIEEFVSGNLHTKILRREMG